MRVLALIAAVLMMTAGCLGDEASDDPIEPSGNGTMASDVNATDEAMAAEPSGNDTDTPDESDAAPPAANQTEPDVPEPSIITEALRKEGVLAPGVGVWPIETNAFIGHDRFSSFDQPGQITSVNLTLTWEPVTPFMETLTLEFGPIEGEGGGDSYIREQILEVVGTSPLTLSMDGLSLTNGAYGFSAYYDRTQPVTVTLEQPFIIEGTYTAIVE